MRKIGMDELRQKQMEVLDYVAAFCDENGIRYWIEGGTLLGAIRHKGYIPWDDDIDIAMPIPASGRNSRKRAGIRNSCSAVPRMIKPGTCPSAR